MVFSSVIFLFLFLPIVLGCYYLLPGREAKNLWLVAASLLFYAAAVHAQTTREVTYSSRSVVPVNATHPNAFSFPATAAPHVW